MRIWHSILLLAVGARVAAAGIGPFAVDGPVGSRFQLEITERLRGELVDWFEPSPAADPPPDARYGFFAHRFQAGVRITRKPFEAFFQYQQTVLAGIPRDGLGPGGVYFANTHQETQFGQWLRQGWIAGTHSVGDVAFKLTVGRQLYRDGGETIARDPTLDWLKRNRIAERLIGPFDYTHVGRSFDGVVVAADHPAVNVTGMALRPTSGGYEIDAGRDISGIDLAGLSATLKPGVITDRTEGRLFWLYYADDRPGDGDVVVLDNRPLPQRLADHSELLLQTIGADAMHVEPIGPGRLDLLVWTLGQVGDWQSLRQRSWGVAAEVGYQMPDWWGRPWVRTGVFHGTGDDDPDDRTHGTLFQLIPTARIYAQTPFYNLMNDQDVFVQLLLQPLPSLKLRTDWHWLEAPDGEDLVYSGGGATKDTFFGYAGIPAAGEHDLAHVVDLSASWAATANVTLGAYYGHVFGGDVIGATFAGRGTDYGYLEVNLAF
jgi:hypothetical protein